MRSERAPSKLSENQKIIEFGPFKIKLWLLQGIEPFCSASLGNLEVPNVQLVVVLITFPHVKSNFYSPILFVCV